MTSEEQGPTPEELARRLRAEARAAATAALRNGLEDIDARYGMHVAEEVVGLLDIAEVFAGLIDEGQNSGGDDDSFEFKSYLNR